MHIVGELISGKVLAIDVDDLISFANAVTGLTIPAPPDFLRFEDVELYICPAGTTIGTIVYPPGFSFQASVVVFGKRANIACSVGSAAVSIKGSLDDFTLGPLAVRGVNDPRPTLDIELSKTRQHIDIDGMVTFFDSEAAVSVQVDVMPRPAFTFDTVSSNISGSVNSLTELFFFSDAQIHRSVTIQSGSYTCRRSIVRLYRQCKFHIPCTYGAAYPTICRRSDYRPIQCRRSRVSPRLHKCAE